MSLSMQLLGRLHPRCQQHQLCLAHAVQSGVRLVVQDRQYVPVPPGRKASCQLSIEQR